MKIDSRRVFQRIRVPFGFLFSIVYLVFARPRASTLLVGGAVAIVGLAVRAWASGHIRKASVLATSGPYAFTRNPLYLGSFLIGAAFCIVSGVWWIAAITVILIASIFFPVMRVEAGDIHEIFGADFEEYKRNVPLLIPRLTPWKRSGNKFDFRLYLQHHEYRAAIGVAAALGVLAAKAYFPGF